MPTAVPTKPAAATKYDTELEGQLAQATRRIRLNDVFAGALVLVAIVLGYVVAMVALDRWVDVPSWVRQAGLVGLCGVLGVVGFVTVVRPLRRVVNPLYAAKQVEETVPDAKNSVVNYVDLHDQPLPDSIREAIGARAAKQLEAADLNEAVNSRALARAGIAVAVLVVALAVLFLAFRPAQFFSLLGRTLTPFSAGAIATRTEIVITEPAGGDATVTAGQDVVVAVTVNGRVPDPDGPNRLRVLLRHNPADPNAEEVPLEPGGSNREWRVEIPRHLVQNGFWYEVAGGDAVTARYRVTVRSRPLFTGFEARYEYPAYLRMKPEVVREAQVEGYRGTQVTLTARTNRELKSGQLEIAGQPKQVVPGVVVGEGRDTLRFRFTLTETSTYQLVFTATTDEKNADQVQYPIRILSDQPPTIAIADPKDEEIVLPTNGLLKVDGAVGDDFGIDTVTLRMRIADGGRVLQPKPYQGGKSFRRDSDGTFPTSLDYKDSVSLAELKDEPGKPVQPAEGMVLEYWLEATDNCTVPKPNVGKSKVRRVRLAAPPPEPMKQQEQQKQTADRKQAETKHQQQQDQKFQNERRDPQQHRPDAVENKSDEANQPPTAPQPQPGDAQPGDKNQGQSKPGGEPKASDAPRSDPPMTTPDQAKAGGTPEAGKTPMPMAGGNVTPLEQKNTGEKPMADRGTPPSEPQAPTTPPQPEKGPPPSPAADPKQDSVKQEARRINEELSRQQQQPEASARGADEQRPQPTQPSSERKGQPEAGGTPQAEPKAGEKGDQTGSAEPKTPGKAPEPPKAAEPKGTPPPSPESGNADGSKTGDPDPKSQPLGGSAGRDKPSEPQQPKAPDQTKPTEPGHARGADKKPESGVADKPGSAKPAGKPEPAETRPAAPEQPSPSEPSPGGAKAEKPTESAERKGGAGAPPADANPQTKPSPEQSPMAGGKDESAASKSEGGKLGKPRLDPKEIEQAVKDLGSGDQQKQQDARQKLDQTVGKPAREEAERIANDLKSGDPVRKETAQKKLDDLKAEAERLSREDVKQDPHGKPDQNVERLFREAQKLNSNNPAERQQAERELDKAVGKEAREELQKKMKDAQPGEPGKDDQTRRQIEEIAKKQQGQPQPGSDKAETKNSDPTGTPQAPQPQNAGGNGSKQPKVDPKEMEQAVKDLASGDPQKQDAARKKLDQMVGKEARQEAEQLMNDLKSDDPARKAAAQKKLDDLDWQARQAAGQQPKREPTAEEKKQLSDAARDLASDDPQKKQAAREKLDQMIGKDAREQAEKLADDLKSGDPQKQAAAKKKLEDLQKQAAGGEPKKPLSPEEMKQLADLAKDLGSKDPAKQKEAAEKFADTPLGKELAEGLKRQAENADAKDPQEALEAAKNLADLQDRMNDLASGDPQKAEEAMKDLKDLAERMKNRNPPRGDGDRPDAIGRTGPGNTTRDAVDPLKGHDDFGKLTSELQLEKFKKVRDNPELLKKLGYTPQDYDRFLKGFEEVVKQEQARPDPAAKSGPAQQTGPAVNVGETSGKLEHRADKTQGSPQGSGPAYSPPGYSEARKKFAEGASKVRREEKK